MISLKAICRGGQPSYGRKRRSIEEPVTAEVTEIFRNLTPVELPLELSIVVQSPVITADHLSRENPDTLLITGGSEFNIDIATSCKRRKLRFQKFDFCTFKVQIIKLYDRANGATQVLFFFFQNLTASFAWTRVQLWVF